MKAFLLLTCAGVAGLGFASHQMVRVSHEITKDIPSGSLELGVRAITGQLTTERLRELGLQELQELPAVALLSDSLPAPIPRHTPTPRFAPERRETPRMTILEAWGDADGSVYARMADGQTYQLLRSGEWTAVQPFDSPAHFPASTR